MYATTFGSVLSLIGVLTTAGAIAFTVTPLVANSLPLALITPMTSPNDLAKQQAFVLRTLEERNIRFVRLWFTDVLGFLKSVAIAPAELDNAFTEGIGFDGSAIEGFARVSESDMLAKPDPSSFSILPWRTEAPGAARMFCDITMPDGKAASVDPRRVLKQTLEKVAKLGYTCYTHPEIEFFLFKDEPKPGQEPIPVDSAGYFDHGRQEEEKENLLAVFVVAKLFEGGLV